jgi:large subunit ribosomal protein L32e
MATKKPKFLRRTWTRYAKLGKGVKKNQKWRKPTGRDNKMREKRKGKPAVVSVGYKKSERERKKFFLVKNIKDLKKTKEKEVLFANIGKKKKIELAKEAKKQGIKVLNLNLDKFLKSFERKVKEETTKKPEVKSKENKNKENKK